MAILVNSQSTLPREASVIDMLSGRGVDGIIAASVERDDPAFRQLAADGIPVVTVNRRMDDRGIPSIINDDEAGIRAVLDHLAGLGHVRIANIAGPQRISTGKERLDAFHRYQDRLGLVADEALIVIAEAFNEDEGERCAEVLLARRIGFTALVCSNDRLAMGAIAALRRHGFAIPGDISVTGFNDMPMADRLEPALTTVRVHQYEAGRRAANVLLLCLDQNRSGHGPKHEILPVELVARRSTAPPRDGPG
jgi:LacI family transcriptional regulator